MSISPWSGAMGFGRLTCLKYYIVPKRENRLILGLNAAENTDYMKKISNESCWDFLFLEKTRWVHMSISPQSEVGGLKDWHVRNIVVYQNGKIDRL